MNSISLILTFALAAYLVASVLYVANLFVRENWPAIGATHMAGAGAVAHLAGLILISHTTRLSPYSTAFGAVVFMAWLVVMMQLGLVIRSRTYAVGAFSLPIAFLMLVVGLMLPPELHNVLPELRRHTMAAHISVTILSYGAFTVAFGLAVIYLLESRMLKAKHLRGAFERLPPLRTAEEMAFHFAAFGHAMLTIGIILGIISALRIPGARVETDPKVPMTLVTWGIYTVYLVLRWAVGWRGRPTTYLLVAGFACVLLTFVGVNLLFPGVHGAFR